jgi:hypothetical protein
MSNSDLIRCQWCGDCTRNTYYKLLIHSGKCRNKADRIASEQQSKKTTKTLFIECSECYALLCYRNQPHNCPDARAKTADNSRLTEWQRLQRGYLRQCEFCGACVRNTVRHWTRCKDRIEYLKTLEIWD